LTSKVIVQLAPGLQKQWEKPEKTPITTPLNDAYRPNVEKWICTCPSFVISRFLLCKHFSQSVHRVPPVFFLEAKRYREPPFWRHKSLRAIEEAAAQGIPEPVEGGDEDDDDEYEAHDDEEEEEEEEYVATYGRDRQTFEETRQTEIDLSSHHRF
jgi:hypothetical protein